MFYIDLQKVIDQKNGEKIIKHLAHYLQHHDYIHTGEFLKQFTPQECEYLLSWEHEDQLLLALLLLHGEGVIIEREDAQFALEALIQLLKVAQLDNPKFRNFSLSKDYQHLALL